MKKLIGLFVILFITTGVFSQISYTVTEFSPQLYFKYSLRSEFTENGKQYALAYDSVWIETAFNPYQKKDIYLWRKDDNGWTIVSDALRTDYLKFEDDDYGDRVGYYDCWVDNPRNSIERGCDLNELLGNDVGYSSIESRNGVLFIKILSFSGIVGDDDYEKHSDRIILVPNEDGTYTTYAPRIKMKVIDGSSTL